MIEIYKEVYDEKIKIGIEDNKILNSHQKEFLIEFLNTELKKYYRLSGGTALSAFYLEHRYSENLDFFSWEKIPLYFIEKNLKKIKIIKK